MDNVKDEKLENIKLENNLEITDYDDLTDDMFEVVEYNEDNSEKVTYTNYSYWKSTFRTFSKNKAIMILSVVLGLVILFAFIQPLLPNQKSATESIIDPSTNQYYYNEPPGDVFFLGSNSIGQDMWARLWAGTRVSLILGISVALTQAILGIVMGTIWGYFRKTEWFFTGLYNIVDNIPQTIILVLLSYILRPSLSTMLFAMCVTSWLQMARYVRNQVIIIRDREYNLASRCLGTSPFRIVVKNILPYLVSIVALRMALAIPAAIGNEVFLTYIGIGLPVTTPSLGNLINEGRGLILSPTLRYQLTYPAILVSFISMSFYIIGNAFSDASDPKNHI